MKFKMEDVRIDVSSDPTPLPVWQKYKATHVPTGASLQTRGFPILKLEDKTVLIERLQKWVEDEF